MTHEELLARLSPARYIIKDEVVAQLNALRAVVELHKPIYYPDKPEGPVWCNQCAEGRGYAKYPCPTIQAIKKELK